MTELIEFEFRREFAVQPKTLADAYSRWYLLPRFSQITFRTGSEQSCPTSFKVGLELFPIFSKYTQSSVPLGWPIFHPRSGLVENCLPSIHVNVVDGFFRIKPIQYLVEFISGIKGKYLEENIHLVHICSLLLLKTFIQLHIHPSSQKSDQNATISLRSFRPYGYQTKMGESQYVPFPTVQVIAGFFSTLSPFYAERQTGKLRIPILKSLV